MFNFRILVSCLICLGSIFVFAVLSQAQQQPDIEKWIEDARIDTQKGAIFNYTYVMKLSYEKKQKLGVGRKFTKLYKAVIPSRFSLSKNYSHPLILIQDSESFVTQEDIDYSIKKVVEEMERAESVVDDSEAENEESNGGYWTMQLRANRQRIKIDILKLLSFSSFSNLQQKQIDGNDIISIDFFPQLSLIFDDSLTYISKIEGQIWIDPMSKRIIRVEGFPLTSFAKIRNKTDAEREDKAVFLFIQSKSPEGFWFPQNVRLDFRDHPVIFKPVKLEFSFSDYQKSNTNVRNVNIQQPQTEKEQAEKSENTPEQIDN